VWGRCAEFNAAVFSAVKERSLARIMVRAGWNIARSGRIDAAER
jgi:endonuclease YncB( thermonuclease family)